MIGLIHGSVDQFEFEIFRAYDWHKLALFSLCGCVVAVCVTDMALSMLIIDVCNSVKK